MRRLRSLPLGLLPLALGGCVRPEVTRVYDDGVPVAERFVHPAAYAAYAHAAELEARGRDAEALTGYRAALSYDPDSPELWTRVGEVGCRLGAADADRALSRAEELSPRYAPAWSARARCHAGRGRLPEALAAARRAFELSPDAEAVWLLARLLRRAGRLEDARRLLIEQVVDDPWSEHAWRELYELARAQKDVAWRRRALERLAEVRERLGPRPEPRARQEPELDPIERALIAGDLARARQLARAHHLDPHVLAALAIVAGRPKLALEEARLRARADPYDADARVAFALAADLAGDRAGLDEALLTLPAEVERVSQLGRWMMAELLARHVGGEAAGAWIDGSEGAPAVGPARLIERLRKRAERPR